MDRIVIPIFFDYASTLCYVAWRIVSELEPELGFTSLWMGVPIRMRIRANQPGMALGPLERMKVKNVIEETGIQVEPPRLWIDSDLALEGAELAGAAGAFKAYHAGVFRAAFEQRLDIAQPAVLAAIAAQAGLGRERFLLDLESRCMAARLIGNKNEADRFSALGYPSFILGDFPLTGIQRVETMRMILGRYISQRNSTPTA